MQHKIADNEYNAKKTELRNMKVLNMRARGRWGRAAASMEAGRASARALNPS